ncbi:CPX chromosomal region candidate gene 1 protein [Dasypus novemcinctus]|uniref:CPX chromosomal region candidate gene 1 protein n=1 Tax=Dasypus novemcinctus TaxID=9361 RepID=UPI0026602F55|nr:CPX chromosomal region candidate gene 1 protein [Dasypus novemcinctus]
MTSPTKEGSDTADNAVKNSEKEATNDCSTDTELQFADPNMKPQVETDPTKGRESGTPTSQENDVPQGGENNKLELEKAQKDPQKEDSKEEESLLIRIPIPQKCIFLMTGLGRITYMSIPVGKIDRNNPLMDRSRFYLGKMVIKTNDFCLATISHKFSLQLSVSWRIPFINNYEIRRMILRLLCGRHFSQAVGHQNTMWVKRKYIAFLPRPNVLTYGKRSIIFGRLLRVYYYRPFIERMTSGKFYKSIDRKGKDEFHIFVTPVFYVPRAQFQNSCNRKTFEDHLRSHHNMRVVIINTNNGWKYLCPICGNSFNTLVQFRQHSCSFHRN